MSRGEVRKTRDGDVHVVCDDERMSDRIQSHTRYRQTVHSRRRRRRSRDALSSYIGRDRSSHCVDSFEKASCFCYRLGWDRCRFLIERFVSRTRGLWVGCYTSS